MPFKMVFLPYDHEERTEALARRVADTVPECHVVTVKDEEEALKEIGDAQAAYGAVTPRLLRAARNLKWIQAPAAAPPVGYYYRELIESPVTVTNLRGIFNDHLAAHIMSFVLAFSRGLHVYIPQQMQRKWEPGARLIHLPDSAALLIGVGGSGGETARLCAAFGMKVIGMDARITQPPPAVSELHRPDALMELLPRADFVIMTVPQTPQTKGMMAMPQFRRMKRTAFLINVGRGGTVELDDLADAIRAGLIAGAGLDVFQKEPLPAEHPLWTLPGVIITPHMAGMGPYLDERRAEVVIDNCRRFAAGQPLRNVVDKANWF